MESRWRNRLIVGGALFVAVWIGGSLADGSLAEAGAIALACGGLMLAWGRWARAETLLLAFLLIGYVVGNRGFAQIMPVPGIPILFGEAMLAISVALLLWRSAFEKQLPFRRDGLNALLLALLVFGGLRMVIDFPRDRFLAVRDFATIYYLGFFFVAQRLASDARERRWLIRAFAGACVVLPWTLAASRFVPEFFLTTLTIRGVPVIFYKDDLAATFLLAGVFVLLESPRLGAVGRWRWLAAATAGVAGVASLSRAAFAGLALASGIAAAARRRRFLRLALALVPIGLIGSMAFTLSRGEPWEQSKAYALYEHALSVADFTGAATYRNTETADSGHNNRFRLVWWQTILHRVLADGPIFGLGFGFDLARDFVAAYDAVGDDFDTRSPHSILFTVFGRLGLLGLALLLLVVAHMGRATWREVRRVRAESDGDAEALALWCAVWVIFVSACFGVVLEGPMGAVVFWTLLGLAHGSPAASATVPSGVQAQTTGDRPTAKAATARLAVT